MANNTKKIVKTGSKSVTYQAETMIVVNSMDELQENIAEKVFGELSSSSQKKVIENQKTFLAKFTKKISATITSLKTPEKSIDDPDMQYIAKKALVQSGRRGEEGLHEELSSLLTERLKAGDEGSEIKKVVFNESIETMEKLTSNHIKIICLMFLVHKTQRNLFSLEGLNNFIEEAFTPYLDVKISKSQFEYLDYAGVTMLANVWGGKGMLESYVKRAYPIAFSKGLTQKEIDNIAKDIQGLIQKEDENSGEERYIFAYPNFATYKKVLESSNITDEKIKDHEKVFQAMEKNKIYNDDSEISDLLSNGSELSDIYNKYFMERNLTAVGTCIAITALKQIDGFNNIDLDIWIN